MVSLLRSFIPVLTWVSLALTSLLGCSPHQEQLHLDATTEELAAAWAQKTPQPSPAPEDELINEIISAGNRGAEWSRALKKIENPSKAFAVTNSTLENPVKYNAKSIISDFHALKGEMPDEVKKVLLLNEPIPEKSLTPEPLLQNLLRRVNQSYHMALRWNLNKGSRDYFQTYRNKDVRGYYFLSQRPGLKQELENWNALSAHEKKLLRNWLEMQCYNSLSSDAGCASEFEAALKENKLWDFHLKRSQLAKPVYESFFSIRRTRKDIRWSKKDRSQLIVSFREQDNAETQKLIQRVIQDFWRWANGGVHLEFHPSSLITLIFKEGATANVNGLGGYLITMNRNADLRTEKDSAILRHEFGHVLGFPDCYVEFYDPREESFIAYFLDSTDIMCSTAGSFKEHHYLELKKAFVK